MTDIRVVIAGGGTGGHVVPGLAIARALVTAGVPTHEIHWIGSERGMEAEAVPAAGFEVSLLPGRGIERSFTFSNVSNVLGIVKAVFKGIGLVRSLGPDVVVSLGGYAAVPAVVGAIATRTPIVIQEQNATPSLANRLASRFAKVSSVLVPGTGLRHEIATGNPLVDPMREAALRVREEPGAERLAAAARLDLTAENTIVAAFGGSLGARRINHAVLGLAEKWSNRTDVSFHHVIGRRDWSDLGERIAALESAPIEYRAVEYEDRMPDVLAAADLAVCRAGGMAVAELTALGTPSILVPLPIAPNDAQRANARALVEAGGAIVVDDASLDVDTLESVLEPLVAPSGSDLRETMAVAARSLGRPDAAEEIASIVLEVADGLR